jgi:GTP cyclohydrolase I
VSDIVHAINEALGEEYPCLGIGLVMKGEHLCKTMRGVKKQGEMTTSRLTGIFKEQETRTEFMNFIK